MDRKGSVFLAFLTVVAIFAFIVFVSMNKEKVLKESKIADIGEVSETVINITLDEEEIELFLEKSMEYASFNALKKLGENGGTLKEQNCEKVNGYVIWKNNCIFPDNLEENFFERFGILFDRYLKEYGLNGISTEWKIDKNNNLVLETKGLVELKYEMARYGFEPNSKYILDYNFGNYNEILRRANECIKEEELKGISRNNLFENCRNDKDFKWVIKVEDKSVLFDVSERYKLLGDVAVKFALPYNQ